MFTLLFSKLNQNSEIHNKFVQCTFPFLDELNCYASRITGNQKEAEKLLLKTFIRAYRFFVNLDENTDYKAWMFRVIRNTYQSDFRKIASGQVRTDYEEINYKYGKIRSFYKGKIPAGQIVDVNLSGSALKDIFNSIPEKFKIVLILTDILKFTYTEAADFMDCPIEIIRKRIDYARRLFFTQLLMENVKRENFPDPDNEFKNENHDKQKSFAAFIDNELTDKREKARIEEMAGADPGIRFDLEVQQLIKKIIISELGIKPVPEKLRNKLRRKIYSEYRYAPGSLSPLKSKNSKPVYSYSILLIVLLAIVLLIFNLPLTDEFRVNSAGDSEENSLIHYAERNFDSYINTGIYSVYDSDNIEEIKSYLKSEGIKSTILIPSITGWRAAGAFITDAGNEKLPNYIYRSHSGKTLYILLVEKTKLNNYQTLTLTDDLLNRLEEDSCLSYTDTSFVTVLSMKNNNVLIAVSDASQSEIEKIVCNNNN